jgi:hypothetical protein
MGLNEVKRKMDVDVISKNGFKITVYEYGNEIKYCLTEKFNPRLLNARDPTFKGSMKECIDYIKKN